MIKGDLSKIEELIYNTHLKITRTHNNKPFRFRKDFSNLEEKHYIALKKLSSFFTKHNHIKIDEFLIAPYKIYKDEEFFDLSYYTTLKAVKAYTLFQNTKLYEEPDSSSQLNYIAESLKFIYKFCKEKSIDVETYPTFCSGAIPECIVHLKEHKVNLLTLLGFSEFFNTIKKIDSDTLKFILGNEAYNLIEINKTKLYTSKKAYKLIQLGVQTIKNNLKKDS